MQYNKSILNTPRLVVLLGFITIFVACAGSNPLSPGAWVPEEDRIAVMDGGPHKGSWKTRDLSIHYEYQEGAPGLQVKGVIELANYIRMGYNSLDYLHLNVHLLESNGFVLSTRRIGSAGFLQPFRVAREMTFSGNFDLTQDTVAFAFSYSGRAVTADGPGPASSSDTEGRIDWEFWKVPHRSPPK